MDIKTKLYQMFILGTDGDCYKNALKNGLGGMIFFSKDIHTPEQFKQLISDIKQASIITPFLSIIRKAAELNAQKIFITEKNIYRQNTLMKKGKNFFAIKPKKLLAS